MVLLDHIPENASPVSVSQAGLIRLNGPARAIALAVPGRASLRECRRRETGLHPCVRDLDHLVVVARVQVDGDRVTQAKKTLKLAVADFPEEADVHAAYAGVLFLEQAYEEAADAFEKALALDPDANESRFSLAMTYVKLSRRGEARDLLEQYVEKGGTEPAADSVVGWLRSRSHAHSTARTAVISSTTTTMRGYFMGFRHSL